jgi:hypothetical protein
MQRRTLLIRRFGAMSFALGYYEDGAWVDHAATTAGRGAVAPEDRPLWDAVHTFFDCCGASITPLRVVDGMAAAPLERRQPRAAAQSALS